MNERFSFRAWNRNQKKFTYWDKAELTFDCENKAVLAFGMADDQKSYLSTYEDLEQCSGLHDKNDKLIFEADIVKCLMVGQTARSYYQIGTIVFVDGCFEVYFEKPFQDRELGIKCGEPVLRHREYVKCFACNNAVEIIGNIHDDPDLLKEVFANAE